MTYITIADITQHTSSTHDAYTLSGNVARQIDRTLWQNFGGPDGCDDDAFNALWAELLESLAEQTTESK